MSVASPATKVNGFFGLVEDDLKEVENLLSRNIVSSVDLTTRAAEDLFSSGGKRLRPALLLLSSRSIGKINKVALKVACVVELIHMASLLHDDVVDGAELRRGKLRKFGIDISILSGDYLFARAFNLLSEINNPDISRLLSEVALKMCEGEILEITHRRDLGISEETYFNIIHRKTAFFMAVCSELGAISGGGNGAFRKLLTDYGLAVGLAFQLTDDILDYTGNRKNLGKEVGADLREGKFTLPLIHTLKVAQPEERTALSSALRKPALEETDVEYVSSVINKYAALDYARKIALKYVDEAKQKILALPESEARAGLVSFADYVINRNN